MKFKTISVLVLILFTSIIASASAQTRERKDIPLKYQWNLSVLYPSVEAWKADLKKIENGISDVKSYKGKLGESAGTLNSALDKYFSLLQNYLKLSSYAERSADENLGDSKRQALRQEAGALGTRLSEAASYIEPEILHLDKNKIDSFISQDKSLNKYKFYLQNILRLKDHTLSAEEEQILASAGMITDNPADVYNIFDNAEMPNPKVTLSNGEVVTLNAAGYVGHRGDKNRADREKIFEKMFGNYGKFENTLGANLAGKVKGDYFYAKNRKYKTVLEASLDANNIPVSVYENLINQINKNLPTLQRALLLKKKMLGVDTLHYYDLYTPIVQAVDMKFTVPEAQKLILDVFKPLGKEYIATLEKAFNNRWIDYYPTAGKRSGAYSTGSEYADHPYILMNWTGDYESVSTLAHELGHTMHSYFSNKNQPFVNSNYATFVAEIASTMNETLLNDYMIKKVKTDDEKLYLLGSYLELLRTTIFRQTSFAEFEWEIHKKIENNEPLTGEVMSNIYYNIVKKYYGMDKGVCVVDPYIAYEWEYIPHFINYTYYVFQYSTSLIYATAFAEKVIDEGQPAVNKFFKILKGGGSDYPINLIKEAGLNPLSSEAFDLTIAKMNKVMDEIEVILNKKK